MADPSEYNFGFNPVDDEIIDPGVHEDEVEYDEEYVRGVKHYIKQNVHDAAIERLEFIFREFENVYFSVSFGKDSSVMLQLALMVAKRLGRLPLHVLYIDFEAQYEATVAHAERMFSREDIVGYWVCLPFSLRNAVSVYEPQWVCWEPSKRDIWVREFPDHPAVIKDLDYFPPEVYHYAMEFETFIITFGDWFHEHVGGGRGRTACGVAIRTDESLNRMRTIMSTSKVRYKDRCWTTKVTENVYNFYPLYDWRTEDIWKAVGQYNFDYNRVYDAMFLGGMSIHEARLCQPYGNDQRRGLAMFQRCEPHTWGKIVRRVSGANFGSLYANGFLLGHRKVVLPEGHTWRSYTEFLLKTLPRFEAEWYMSKFRVFEKWWRENYGYTWDTFFDAIPPKDHPAWLKPDGTRHRKLPAWERLAKVIIKNDKVCKALSFGASPLLYQKYMEFKERYGE